MSCIECLQVRAGTAHPTFGLEHEAISDSSDSPSSAESGSGSDTNDMCPTYHSGEQQQEAEADGFAGHEAIQASNHHRCVINGRDPSAIGTNLVGCGVRKLYGTPDGDVWYAGKVVSYSRRTTKYTLVNCCHGPIPPPPPLPPPPPPPPPSVHLFISSFVVVFSLSFCI